MNWTRFFVVVPLALTLLALGCGDPQKDAEAALAEYSKDKGLTDLKVVPIKGESKRFAYTARRPKTGVACRGTVTLGGTSPAIELSCDKPKDRVPTDPHDRLDYFCRKGKLDACFKLGKAHEERKVGAPDLKVARSLYKKACKGKVYPACEALGFFALRRLGGPLDLGEAEFALTKACEGGVTRGCTNLAHVHVQNRKWDAARALFKAACLKGDMKACNGYGTRLNSKFGKAKPNPKKARAIFLKACDADFMNACTNYGVMLLKGQGGRRDKVRAKRYFRKACEGKDPPGCYNLKLLNK